jgi:hypothetical protein
MAAEEITWDIIKSEDTEKIKSLLANGLSLDAIVVNPDNNADYTLLLAAVMEGRADIVEVLLKAGVQPNIKSGETQSTPLHAAVHMGQLEIIKSLIQSGADINEIHPHYHCTPLFFAIKNKHHEIAKILLENGATCRLEGSNPGDLMLFMESLGYFSIEKDKVGGVCFGYGFSGIDALLLMNEVEDNGEGNGLDAFRSGIASIYAIVRKARNKVWKKMPDRILNIKENKEKSFDKFEEKIQKEIREIVKSKSKWRFGRTLEYDGLEINATEEDIMARCDKIEGPQHRYKHPELVPDEIPKTSLSQNILASSEFFESQKIKDRGGKVIVTQVAGIYDLSRFMEYFSELRHILEQSGFPHPIAFHLSANKHTIAIGFDAKKNKWIYLDVNYSDESKEDVKIEIDTDQEMAKTIFRSFIFESKEKKILVSTTAYMVAYKNKEEFESRAQGKKYGREVNEARDCLKPWRNNQKPGLLEIISYHKSSIFGGIAKRAGVALLIGLTVMVIVSAVIIGVGIATGGVGPALLLLGSLLGLGSTLNIGIGIGIFAAFSVAGAAIIAASFLIVDVMKSIFKFKKKYTSTSEASKSEDKNNSFELQPLGINEVSIEKPARMTSVVTLVAGVGRSIYAALDKAVDTVCDFMGSIWKRISASGLEAAKGIGEKNDKPKIQTLEVEEVKQAPVEKPAKSVNFPDREEKTLFGGIPGTLFFQPHGNSTQQKEPINNANHAVTQPPTGLQTRLR